MKLLALDTATEACSAALWLDGQVHARFEVAGRTHTQRLQPMVQGLMGEAGLSFSQLDGLVCGVGPGSFAGVRIAVSFAKGLALGADLPAVGVSSLALLAQRALNQGAARVLSVIDARMGEVYAGAFVADAQGRASGLVPERVCAPGAVTLPVPGGWHAVGSGWKTYPGELRAAYGLEPLSVDGEALPRAEDAFKLVLPAFESGAAADAEALTPVYLRNKVALTLSEQAKLRSNQA